MRTRLKNVCALLTVSTTVMVQRCSGDSKPFLGKGIMIDCFFQRLEREGKENEALNRMMANEQKTSLLNLFQEKNRPTLQKWPQVMHFSISVFFPDVLSNWNVFHSYFQLTDFGLDCVLGHRCSVHCTPLLCRWMEEIYQVMGKKYLKYFFCIDWEHFSVQYG